MENSQRITLLASITAIIVAIMTARDLLIGEIDYGGFHIVGKSTFFMFFAGIALAPRAWKNKWAHVVMPATIVMIFVNCAHGLSYEPGYHMGFNLALLLILLIYNQSKTMFIALMVIGFAILGATLFSFDVRPDAKYLTDWRTHVLVDFFVMGVITWFVYRTIFEQSRQKDALFWRYIDVGRQTSMIVHDLKGGFTAPVLCAGLLEKELKESGASPRLRELAEKLNTDLHQLSLYTAEVKQLSRVENQDKQFFMLSDAVKSVMRLLESKLEGVLVHIDKDVELFSDENLLRRIFLNILLNSIQEEASDRMDFLLQIRVDTSSRTIVFDDDGPGFSPEMLRAIRKRLGLTTRLQGSGLGCQIISDYMMALNGKAHFSNNPSGGARVELVFDESSMRAVGGFDIRMRGGEA